MFPARPLSGSPTPRARRTAAQSSSRTSTDDVGGDALQLFAMASRSTPGGPGQPRPRPRRAKPPNRRRSPWVLSSSTFTPASASALNTSRTIPDVSRHPSSSNKLPSALDDTSSSPEMHHVQPWVRAQRGLQTPAGSPPARLTCSKAHESVRQVAPSGSKPSNFAVVSRHDRGKPPPPNRRGPFG